MTDETREIENEVEDTDDEREESGREESSRSDRPRRYSRSDRGPRPMRGRGRNQVYCPPGKCFDYKEVDTLRED